MSEAQEVCRNFRNNGSCRYGDKCRFEHSEGEPIQQVPAGPPGQCFKFAEGQCTKGDRCRFMHGENDPRFDSEGKRDVSKEVCNNYQRGRCALGDQCLRQHVEKEAKEDDGNNRRRRNRGPRLCRNFRDNGECADGDKCEYKHGMDDPRFPAPEKKENGEKKPRARRPRKAAGEEGEGGEPSRRRRRPRNNDGADRPAPAKLDEECNNYKAGRCRFGDTCRRQHIGDVEPVTVEKIDEICNNFQNGRCRFGEHCRRQHVAAN